MKIETYYQKLNEKSQEVFVSVVKETELLSRVHSGVADLYTFSQNINDADEAQMFRQVCSQLESSCLALSFGLYRSSLASLRQGFEFGMGAILFSSNKLAHREWINGRKEADLKWSTINSPETGVLSKRFVNAFFPGLEDIVDSYQEKATIVYRCLSEYVHGNSETWKSSGLVLSRDIRLERLYFEKFSDVIEILKFSFCCRYLRDLTKDQLEEVQSIVNDALTHIAPIREFLGGPKDIK